MSVDQTLSSCADRVLGPAVVDEFRHDLGVIHRSHYGAARKGLADPL